MLEQFAILLTCEHGGNQVPQEYRELFRDHAGLLQTHRGYDIGILPVAERLAGELGAQLVTSRVTRLLVDLNRSRHNRNLFSEISRNLAKEERELVIEKHYLPYRQKVESFVAEATAKGGRVIQLSMHSFTPELHGKVRNADIGLLYDPGRPREMEFCLRLKEALRKTAPTLRVRRNYPYRGRDDGLQTALRHRFAPDLYLGMELEINQGFPLGPEQPWQRLQDGLRAALKAVISSFESEI